MGLVVIFCSLFKKKPFQTKNFEFFYILAIEAIMWDYVTWKQYPNREWMKKFLTQNLFSKN